MSLMSIFVTDFWLKKSYQLSTGVIVCCVVNCYLFIIGLPASMMMTVSGMFDKERNISIFYATVNLVISLLLVKPFGIIGVLLGTSASYLVQIIFRIRTFFRNYLYKSNKRYVFDILQYTILSCAETAAAFVLVNHFYQEKSLLSLFLSILLCVLLPTILNILLFWKSWRMQSIFLMIQETIKH